MTVGHGELGVRSPMRPFAELIAESHTRKDAYVDLHAAALVTGPWSADGDAWGAGWNRSFDGVPLDVVGVKTLAEVLRRVETLAICQATEGTYFYDVDEALVTPPLWDDGESEWDLAGLFWDEGAVLYVHLTGDVDPNDILVTARAGFYVGTAGAKADHLLHPWLGDEKLTDGAMDIWTSATNLTHWTETSLGVGWSVGREDAIIYEGTFSCRLRSTGTASGSTQISQAQACVVGKMYRCWGRYYTETFNATTSAVYVRVGASTFLGDDGRTNNAADGAELQLTGGRWRNFCFDFIAHEATPDLALRLTNSAATQCVVYFDDVHLKRIYRFNYYAPRLQAEGLPESAMAATDVYPGSEETGGGTITCANDGSAYFERMTVATWSFLGKPVIIRYGGAFPDGQEVLDLEPGFFGMIAGDRPFRVSDRQAQFDVEEVRNRFERPLPPNFYTLEEFSGMSIDDVGRRRAMIFGVETNVRPVRISADETTLLGTYEVADPTHAADRTIAGVSAVYAYADDDAAEKKDTARRVTLIGGGGDYNTDLDLGQIELIQNPGPFEVVSLPDTEERGSNDRVDFVANSVTYEAIIPDGCYSSDDYRGLIELQMNDVVAGGTGITVTYSNTTHKFTIAWGGAGNFQLLLSTGVNKHRNALAIAGFTDSDDKTGATTYTSDDAVFTDSDAPILRVDATGYRDDAAGTYTGTANATIQLGPDVIRFLLLRVPDVALDLGASQIDEASFVAARTSCPQPLAIYLGNEDMAMHDVIDRIEAGCFGDVVIDGGGIIHYVFRDGVVPASAPSIFDRDYLSFEGYIVGDDAYGTIVVRYAQDPTTELWKSRSFTNDETVLLQSRGQERTFLTFLRDEADAANAVVKLEVLARAPTRHFAFAVKGKLLRSKIGDLVLLTRDQALAGTDEDTSLDLYEGRILELKKNYMTGRCEAVVHTNVVE